MTHAILFATIPDLALIEIVLGCARHRARQASISDPYQRTTTLRDTTNTHTATLYDSILDEISSGRLVGGQRLKVSELAKQFGVSTSPVREALRQMHGEGFVSIQQNRGAIVKKADASTIQNIFEVLQLLEPYFVRWFAEYAESTSIDDLQLVQDQLQSIGKDQLVRFRQLDTEFHSLIYRNHYNSIAWQNWKKLRTALTVHSAPLRINPIRTQTILQEHDALIGAFRENDVAQADATIRKHLSGSYEQMSKQIRAMGL